MILAFLLWSRKRRCEKVRSHLFLHLATLQRGFSLRPCCSGPLVTGIPPSWQQPSQLCQGYGLCSSPSKALSTLLKSCHTRGNQVFAFHRAPDANHSSGYRENSGFYLFFFIPLIPALDMLDSQTSDFKCPSNLSARGRTCLKAFQSCLHLS